MSDLIISGLFAYPSNPPDIGRTITDTLNEMHQLQKYKQLKSWEETDIPGRFISTEILKQIEEGTLLIADITRLNFNVIFEIGYGIASHKRVFLLRNITLSSQLELIAKVGIFDTIGYKDYDNAKSLKKLILSVDDLKPLHYETSLNNSTPVYMLLPQRKGDVITRLISRVKKARLFYRSFDPEEQGRLSAIEAIENVSASHGVIIPLMPKYYEESDIHNFRAAFVAGLAYGMDKHLLLLQEGDGPVPLDYRDLVRPFKDPSQIDDYLAEFAPPIYEAIQSVKPQVVKGEASFLMKLPLGASSAENEFKDLSKYYLETDEFRRALRGEVHVVLGRKGAGKSALFFQLRDRVRASVGNIVLDLKPEGFQLIKFKKQIFDIVEEGSREHTIVAFWEYLLFLEICNKLIQNDRDVHIRNRQLYEPYRRISNLYESDEYIAEGDFSERISNLANRIAEDIDKLGGETGSKITLDSKQITELIYKHNLNSLRAELLAYLQHKKSLWVLFDNLDKGWNPFGVEKADIISLHCLLEAMRKIERSLMKKEIEAHCIVFIRDDVYEHLIEYMSDRGKLSHAHVDWTDQDLLLEMLRQRFISVDEVKGDPPFEDIWSKVCVSHIKGEATSQYMLDRCLMRPRSLIDFLRFCRSHALNLKHSRIEEDDIIKGEEQFSTHMVQDVGFEINDIYPKAKDILLQFIEVSHELSREDVDKILSSISVDKPEKDKIFDLLIWYGVIGYRLIDNEPVYIYLHHYDMKRMKAIISKHEGSDLVYTINPAFWKGLEVKQGR